MATLQLPFLFSNVSQTALLTYLPNISCIQRAFGTALSPLTCLKVLHLGIYLSPVDFFDAHIDHGCLTSGSASYNPFAFQNTPWPPHVCILCQIPGDVREETRAAEERAAKALAVWLGALERIGWATLFAPDPETDGEASEVDVVGLGEEGEQLITTFWVKRGEAGGEERIDVRRKPW